VIGEFLMHNYIPKVYEKIKARGNNEIEDIFN